MNREQRTIGIVLKKQQLGESDELVTLFTEDFGKYRLLAKAAKKLTSRLQYSLQGFSEVAVRFQGGSGIPKIIGVQTVSLFPGVYTQELKLLFLFWLAELVLKSTPDEQPNQALYALLKKYIAFVDVIAIEGGLVDVVTCKAIVDFLAVLGLGLHLQRNTQESVLFFSNTAGGVTLERTADASVLQNAAIDNLFLLSETSLLEITKLPSISPQLKPLLHSFLQYQLERTINAARFLDGHSSVI